MEKKCICFCRVSTQLQSLDEQKETVIANAIADGYKRDEIAIVEGKESAIKLKEEERQTIAEMKKIISENPSIESVYVFAIDRLARRVSVILSVKDYLTEHKINLVFLNPHKMGTLRKDNKTGEMVEDELTSLLLMLLSYGADMEMKIKKERFETAKNALRRQGKIASGRVLYGYKKLDDNSIGIDKDEAKIVRYIYDLYLKEDISLQAVYKRLIAEGKWDKTMRKRSTGTRIRMILTNPAYCGENPLQRSKGKKGVMRTENYPAIITADMQSEVLAKLKLRNNMAIPKTDTKTIYYGKGIVKFRTEEGKEYVMSPIRRDIQYAIKEDNAMASISCNVIDSILWNEAQELKEKNVFLDFEESTEKYTESIEANKHTIATIQLKLDDVSSRKEKAFRMYLNGGVSEEIYNSVMKEIDEDISNYTKEIARLESANASMQMMIDEYQKSQGLTKPMFEDVKDDDERKKIIQSVIEKIVVSLLEKRGHNGKVRLYRIDVVPKDILKPFFDNGWHYEYYGSAGAYHLFFCSDDGKTRDDFTCWIEQRIKPYPKKK